MDTPTRVGSYAGQQSTLNPDSHHEQYLSSHSVPQSSLDAFLSCARMYPREYPRLVVTPTGKAVVTPLGSPLRVVPPSRSRLEGNPAPPPFSQHSDPRVIPPVLQRTHFSDPGSTLTRVRPAQFLYYHQAPGPDTRGPPIAWNTRELVMRSPPLPRQRSARACKKCRKRKTKVCVSGRPQA